MTISEGLFKKASSTIPGGVNSPVRAFNAVGGKPLFIKKGMGSKIYDVDNNEYIDYVGSWGPLILGHSHPDVIESIKTAVDKGTSFGAPTEAEIEIANIITDYIPSIEMVRMVNSGTEATMSAIRLARGYTKRDLIVKFEGCYHGHADGLLVKAGSGAATLGIPDSAGVPNDYAKNTLTLQYNNIEELENTFKERGESIACLIIEPVAGNMGVVVPRKDFLESIRSTTEKYGTLLIFDEVMTGFRVSRGGAQELFNIDPDITCLGKIIGGGLPVGAYGGKRKIMEKVAPCGAVYQAGTLSGNPVAMAAGITTLKILADRPIYENINNKTAYLLSGLKKGLEAEGIPHTINSVGSMFSVFFTDKEVFDFETAKTSDTDLFSRYFSNILNKGIYIAPSQFEAGFMSNAHSENDLDKTIEAATEALKGLV